MKLKSKKWLLFIPIIGLLLIIPFALTSCDDPATFFQQYGNGQNSGSSDSSSSSSTDDDSGSSKPNIPTSPY
ncbi:MAG: hypothetical protein K2J02_02145 [Malacoplasma sp.]|nr:hypothetical protein [Malacoplasma sp.]